MENTNIDRSGDSNIKQETKSDYDSVLIMMQEVVNEENSELSKLGDTRNIASTIKDIKHKCEAGCNCPLLTIKQEELDIKEEILDSAIPRCTESDLAINFKTNSEPKASKLIINEGSFTCNFCNVDLLSKTRLKGHLLIHGKEKPFKCSICNYNCFRKLDLTKHLRTHTGEKPFNCTVCDYKCSVKNSLSRHLKTHSSKKEFICKICNDKFTIITHLTHHLRSHTGEKPFVCAICNYRCSVKSGLARHIKIHTGEKPFN